MIRRALGLDEPRPDWVEELPVEYGRAGEPIYTTINATHLDRVLRAWQPTVVRQWKPTIWPGFPKADRVKRRRAA